MIGRNVPLKRELIEQSSLLNLLMPHHDSVPSRRLNQRISPRATADFFNTIGQLRTLPDSRDRSLGVDLRCWIQDTAATGIDPRHPDAPGASPGGSEGRRTRCEPV